MYDTTQAQAALPPKQISVSARLLKGISFTLIALLAIAGTTLGTITIFQLNNTRHQLTQTQASLSQTQSELSATEAQLSGAQSQINCMLPSVNFLSQFAGLFSQPGNDGNTWYSPATDSHPTASSNVTSCS